MKPTVRSLLILFAFLANTALQAQALTGTKNVGTGGDYASLSAAVTDINTKGVTGTLTLLITGDLTESGSPEITSTTLTGTNFLVIKPAAGKTPTVTFTACAASGNRGNSGLAISGTTTNVGNITIDGSNTAGGTTRDMTFALGDTTNGRFCIRVNGESDNVVIKNLKIAATAIKPTTASGSRTYGVYALSSTTAASDDFQVLNCEIGSTDKAFYYGIYKPDGGTVPYGARLTLAKNKIYAQHKGISVWGTDEISNINNNAISVIGHPTGAYVQNSINGIYAESWKGTLNIFNNQIITLKAKALTQTALKPMYGIIVYYASGSGITGQTANIWNNFVSDFYYTGDATTLASEVTGIAIDALDQNVNAYYNSIYFQRTGIAGNPVFGIRVYDDVGMAVNLKNNIISNNVDVDSAYAIYVNPIVNNCLKTSDYNDLNVTSAKASVGYYNGAAQKTLANWKAASGKDANSINVNPAFPFGGNGQFISPLNLHWVSKPDMVFAGAPITGYDKDIDGDIRNTTKPYMGADEGPSFTGIEHESSPVKSFELSQNYPNPFNPSTLISFTLSKAADVTITVFNQLGQAVRVIERGNLTAGAHTQILNAEGFSSGIYYYQVQAGDAVQMKKMIVLK